MARTEVVGTVTGTVWKTEIKPGSRVAAGETILVIESMKMEIPILATRAGTLTELLVSEDDSVDEGQILAIMEC